MLLDYNDSIELILILCATLKFAASLLKARPSLGQSLPIDSRSQRSSERPLIYSQHQQLVPYATFRSSFPTTFLYLLANNDLRPFSFLQNIPYMINYSTPPPSINDNNHSSCLEIEQRGPGFIIRHFIRDRCTMFLPIRCFTGT